MFVVVVGIHLTNLSVEELSALVSVRLGLGDRCGGGFRECLCHRSLVTTNPCVMNIDYGLIAKETLSPFDRFLFGLQICVLPIEQSLGDVDLDKQARCMSNERFETALT